MLLSLITTNSIAIANLTTGSLIEYKKIDVNTMCKQLQVEQSEIDSIVNQIEFNKGNKDDIIVYELNFDLMDSDKVYEELDLIDAKERYDNLKQQGFEKTAHQIYILRNNNLNGIGINSDTILYTDIVYNNEQFNSPSKVISNKRYGMSHWLDVGFELLVGTSTTKYAWKAASILGVKPSNFLATYQKGDMLEQSYLFSP